MLVFISTSGRKVRNLIGVSTINLQIEIQQIDDHCRHLAVWCHKIAGPHPARLCFDPPSGRADEHRFAVDRSADRELTEVPRFF